MINRGSVVRLKNGESFSISYSTDDEVAFAVSDGIGSVATVTTIDSEGVVLLADALYKSVGLEPIEQLYYLKLLDGVNELDREQQYINFCRTDDEIWIDSSYQDSSAQTKFTLHEINSNPKLKKYAQFKVPVK